MSAENSAEDLSDVDLGLRLLVERMREGAAPDPAYLSEDMVELASTLESRPLALFVQSVVDHVDVPDFGRFELEAESIEENSYYEDIVAEIEGLGVEVGEGLLIGTSGGGSEALLMLADAERPEGYTIFMFAYDGSPYENGKTVNPIGTFEHLLRALRDTDDLSDDVLAIVANLDA